MVIVGRAVAGMGSAGILSGCLAILGATTPIETWSVYVSVIMSTLGIAIIAGPLLGGLFCQKVSWRWWFCINLPVGAVTELALILLFKSPTRKGDEGSASKKLQNIDVVGVMLFIPACIMILLALQWGGNEYAWKSAVIIGFFFGFGGTMVIFLLWQYYKRPDAMISLSILFNRTLLFATLAMFLGQGGFYVTVYYLPSGSKFPRGESEPQQRNVPSCSIAPDSCGDHLWRVGFVQLNSL